MNWVQINNQVNVCVVHLFSTGASNFICHAISMLKACLHGGSWPARHERDPGQAGYPTLTRLRGKLSPRLRGLPYLADQAARLNVIKIK